LNRKHENSIAQLNRRKLNFTIVYESDSDVWMRMCGCGCADADADDACVPADTGVSLDLEE
jgi:hypothetical protein